MIVSKGQERFSMRVGQCLQKDEVGMLEVWGPLGRSVGSSGARSRSRVEIRKDRVIFQKISKSRYRKSDLMERGAEKDHQRTLSPKVWVPSWMWRHLHWTQCVIHRSQGKWPASLPTDRSSLLSTWGQLRLEYLCSALRSTNAPQWVHWWGWLARGVGSEFPDDLMNGLEAAATTISMVWSGAGSWG